MMRHLQEEADIMAPTMRFLVSVCVSKRYKDSMKPVLDRLAERYSLYVDKAAQALNCDRDDIEPYVYMAITAVANYMIFAEDALVKPQLTIVKEIIRKFQQIQLNTEGSL